MLNEITKNPDQYRTEIVKPKMEDPNGVEEPKGKGKGGKGGKGKKGPKNAIDKALEEEEEEK